MLTKSFRKISILMVGLFLLFAVSLVGAAGKGQVYVFNTPVGADEPGPLLPGHSYSATFSARQGDHLSFATMFVQSNDWFIAPNQWGVSLFDNAGNPRTGDISNRLFIFDAGTEADEPVGSGENQAPRQAGANSGPADPDNRVRYIRHANGYARATLMHDGSNFTLNIENISGNLAMPTPLAPGVVIVHRGVSPLFSPGQADFGEGLEALAEDGNPMVLAESFGMDMPATSTGAIVFNTPNGADEPAPALPGGSYTFDFSAQPGDHVSFATMFVQSNDWFIGTGDWGIELYNGLTPRSGDVTNRVFLLDAGTEMDEPIGTGENQAPRQAGANSGPADPNNQVRYVRSATPYVKVTLTHRGSGNFTIRIDNISDVTPLAPGVAVVHNNRAPLYQIGMPDYGQGLEALAEDGNPAVLAGNLN